MRGAMGSLSRIMNSCRTGRSFALMRTSDGCGVGPLLLTRSTDGGEDMVEADVLLMHSAKCRS